MAKKKNLKLLADSKTVLIFAAICSALFIFDAATPGLNLAQILFTCPGNRDSFVRAFDFFSPADYLKIILYAFGHSDVQEFFANLAILLLLGPVLEERYGSKMIALMTGISTLVTGVLCVSLSPISLSGSSQIVFMMIFLTFLTERNRRSIKISWLALLCVYIFLEISVNLESKVIFEKEHSMAAVFLIKNTPILFYIIGGSAGGIFGLLVRNKESTPKKTATKN